MRSLLFSVAMLLASTYLVGVSSQIILEVPGYAVLNGTSENSTYTEREFFAFRSIFYAEKPTPQTRFLVRSP